MPERIMTEEVSFMAGCLLVGVLCIWAVYALTAQLRWNMKSGITVDRTLSEVDENDAPGMFAIQMVGMVLLTIVSALIGIVAIVSLILKIATDSPS
jgi:hypothetical protein